MKKLVNILLVLAMVLGMIPTMVNAEKSYNTNDGKITIKSAKENQVYKIYEVLELESFDSDKKAYAYKATEEAWKTFINSTGIKGVYVNVDAQGYVTWVPGKDNEAGAAEFAAKALAHAKANNIVATATKESGNSTTVEFTGLNLGYYLVDSSLGALCGLTTTAKAATIYEKNTAGNMEKEVKIDAVNYGDSNTASIGDTIEYKIEVTIGKGAETYTLTDLLDESLTLKDNSISVTAPNFTDFATVDTTATNDYTFKVVIEGSKLAEGTIVTITYKAVLNEKAEKVNNNKATLVYGNNNKIEKETKTYTYEFDLIKTDSSNVLLDGAKFKLYDAATGGNEIKVILIDEANHIYRVATKAENAAEAITVTDGKATIFGLGNGTYYLEETKQPEGYNKLASRVEVKVENADNKATTETADNVIKYVRGGVRVINYNGTVLPTTGGLGTTLFIAIGSLVALMAAVVLVTNKRMANENI
ncbi:MAG: SpaH/EbpB family LPXTG-anchored major pilin [Erysipelotrichaceae bacterium]|nr:SpaH/EbpB family LPXTG-anchored major pilin [Erysipelotrichaceae bacterium]